jgi:hypothetical protein
MLNMKVSTSPYPDELSIELQSKENDLINQVLMNLVKFLLIDELLNLTIYFGKSQKLYAKPAKSGSMPSLIKDCPQQSRDLNSRNI